MRFGDWKAVRPDKGKPVELYNLGEDLGESRDIAKQKPEVAREMERLMRSLRVESPAFPT